MGSDELSAALWMLGRDLSPPRRSSSRRQQGHCCDALRELSPSPLGCSPFHSTHFSSRGPSAFPSLFCVSGSEGQESSLALGMRVVRKPCEVLGATNTERHRVALRRTGPKWPLHRGSSLLQEQLTCTAYTSTAAIVTWGKVLGRCQDRSDLPLLPTPLCAPFHGCLAAVYQRLIKHTVPGPTGN